MGLWITLNEGSQSGLGAVACAAAAEPDSQVKLDDTGAQLLVWDWGGFIHSVAVSSGIASLTLCSGFVVKIPDCLYSPCYSMKVMFGSNSNFTFSVDSNSVYTLNCK